MSGGFPLILKRIMTTATLDISTTANLLGSMYLCKPSREVLEAWKTLLSEDVPDLLTGLSDAINNINPDSEQEMDDLLWEHTRLFIGPYKLPCPPWESVYTSHKKLMMQDAYKEVKKLYAEVGVEIGSQDIMADHIGAELNFLALLFQKMGNEPEQKLYYADIANRFLEEHLMRWVPQFLHDMKEAADSLFYERLADATENFLTTNLHPVRI